jgi:hypothetical protein
MTMKTALIQSTIWNVGAMLCLPSKSYLLFVFCMIMAVVYLILHLGETFYGK